LSSNKTCDVFNLKNLNQTKPNLITFFLHFVFAKSSMILSKFQYKISPRALCGITLRIFFYYQRAIPSFMWRPLKRGAWLRQISPVGLRPALVNGIHKERLSEVSICASIHTCTCCVSTRFKIGGKIIFVSKNRGLKEYGTDWISLNGCGWPQEQLHNKWRES
jgi:hypothetical protein